VFRRERKLPEMNEIARGREACNAKFNRRGLRGDAGAIQAGAMFFQGCVSPSWPCSALFC
jgi:hypothetical protein